MTKELYLLSQQLRCCYLAAVAAGDMALARQFEAFAARVAQWLADSVRDQGVAL